MKRWAYVLGWVLCCASVRAAEPGYELAGQLDPPRGRVLLNLDGIRTPFTAHTFSDSRGRFQFRGLTAGPYTLRMFVPGLDEVRQTVEVTASLADSSRRVSLKLTYDPSGPDEEARKRKHAVSARELSLPGSAIREYKQAQVLLGKHEVAAAIERLERAVELAPRFTEAWNNLGTIAYVQARYEDAERYFRSALKHDPGAYVPALNLGGVLVNLGRLTEALEYNLYAVLEKPKDALAQSQLGMTYFYLGRPEPALKHLKEAKRLDPGHFSHPQRLLAQIYLERGDIGAAVAELEEFLRLHPDAAEAAKVREVLTGLKAKEGS